MLFKACVYEEADTSFGKILVAECVSSSKVVAVYFVDDDLDDKLAELSETFPAVEFSKGKPTQLEKVVQAINSLDTSIEIKSIMKCETEFAVQVMDAIKAIPKGQTKSYSQIAQLINKPDAYRAVARVCASNNLAYIIPCHRVIASNGALSGYRWGLDKKRELLAAEGALLSHAVM